MGNEWVNTTVGEFAPFTYGKGLPERARNESGTVPVFGSNGVVGKHDCPYVEACIGVCPWNSKSNVGKEWLYFWIY